MYVNTRNVLPVARLNKYIKKYPIVIIYLKFLISGLFIYIIHVTIAGSAVTMIYAKT